MFRRHFFLIGAIVAVLLMAGAGTWKLMHKDPAGAGGPGGAPGGAAAGGRGGAPGGGAAGGAPGRGGPGGAAGGRGGPGRGGAVVSAATIMPHTFADRLQVLGVAKGRESVTLTSVTSEYVEAVRFRPGDHVQRNQVLIELKRTEEDAGIAQARSTLNLAKLNADRNNILAAKGVVTQQQADATNAAREQAQATLEAAESRAGDRVIRAPFSGRIGLSDIAPGALMSPGSVIATLDDTTTMRVDFDVPDRFLSSLRLGGAITATTDAYPGEQYRGRIAQLDTRIDERTRTIKARAEFPNPGERLKPGMLMRVGVDRGTREAPAAPESGVQFTGNQAFVFLIASRNGGNFAEQRNVVVGEIQDGLVEIREGLAVCDRIVADGLNKVQSGASLTIAGAGGRGGGRGGPGGGRGGPAGAGAPKAGGAPAGTGQGRGGPPSAGGGRGGSAEGAGARSGGRGGPSAGRGGPAAGRGGPPPVNCSAPGGGRGGPNGDRSGRGGAPGGPGGVPGGARDGAPTGGGFGGRDGGRGGRAGAAVR